MAIIPHANAARTTAAKPGFPVNNHPAGHSRQAQAATAVPRPPSTRRAHRPATPPGPVRTRFTAPALAMVSAVAMLWPATHGPVAASQPDPATSPGDDVITDSIGIQLVALPAGTFVMGLDSPNELRARHPHSSYNHVTVNETEQPQAHVRITRPFRLGRTEVTVGQFAAFVEATNHRTTAERQGGAMIRDPEARETERFIPSPDHHWRQPGFEQTDDHPVTSVSWHDAVAFCRWLSEVEGARYRLPTEAEWEYACRAGTTTLYFTGDDPDQIYAHANVADASLAAHDPDLMSRQQVLTDPDRQNDGYIHTAPVASFKPNPWGLFDMHGNVWEWCSDRYQADYYRHLTAHFERAQQILDQQPYDDPGGPDSTPQHEHGDWRSLRGGSWYVSPVHARSSNRAFADANDHYPHIGFRVVREIEP